MAEKLIVDIGNTRTKLAVFQNNTLSDLQVYDGPVSGNVLEIVKKHPTIQSSILSSVRNYPENINQILTSLGFFIKLDQNTKLPFENKYGTPSTLGKDRIAIAAEACNHFPGENVLAIDAGTTVTYDFINSKGEYLGGSISPGIHMRLNALHTFTDQLPLIELKDTQAELTGNSTEHSIISGVLNGMRAEIDGIINQYREQYHSLKIIFGGGDYKYFDKRLKNNIFATPNIVLKGLKVILDFNEEI
ncbi:MAG: type III pantothenate kinase [Bacteroidales bacterium]|nr:type III pantothenate kinase [Bacteroidales bacterium]